MLAKTSKEVVEARAALTALTSTNAEAGNDQGVRLEVGADDAHAGSEDPLLDRSGESTPDADVIAAKAAHEAVLSATTARISSQGIALGYAAGIAMLLLALIPVRMMGGSTASLRLAIGLSGVWWLLFSVPAGILLPSASKLERSEHEEDEGWAQENEHSSSSWSTWREIKNAWKRLGGMLRWREIKRLRNTFVYLAAWFVLSDGLSNPTYSRWLYQGLSCAFSGFTGFTTITSTAILFGKTSLNMSPSALILIGALTPSAGILGSLIWPMIQRRAGWSNLRVLVVLVGMASVIPAYGCLGFLPVFQHGTVKFGGLTTPGEMYGLAVYFVSSCFVTGR